MSFLAKLRTQAPAETSQTLCYLLKRSDSGLWGLSLQLATLVEGKVRQWDAPYTLVHSHLQMPPAFLTPADVSLLQQLLNASSEWLNRSFAQALPEKTNEFLAELLATQKVYIQLSVGHSIKLALGHAVSAGGLWVTEGDGGHRFRVVLNEEAGLASGQFAVLPLGGVLLVLNAQHGTLHPLEGAHTVLAEWFERVVANHNVNDFIAKHGNVFQTHHLTLPKPLSHKPLLPDVSAVLIAQTKTTPRGCIHQLSLTFRVETPIFCVAVDCDDIDSSISIFVEGEVNVITLPVEQCQKIRNVVTKQLPANAEVLAQGVWEISDKADWQVLFYEKQPVLLSSGITLIAAECFEYPYVVGGELSLSAKAKNTANGQQLVLDLTTQMNDGTISLIELLKNLKDAGDSHYIEYTLSDNSILLLPRTALASLSSELGDWIHSGCKPISASQGYRLQKLKDEGANVLFDLDNAAVGNNIWQPPKEVSIQKDTVKAQLRPYQWLGVYWLLHIHECGFNGLLADDMGLGKTLQTITFLSVLKQQGRLNGMAVIVAPTSLLHNWACEFKKFCPSLLVKVLHGAKRHALWPLLDGSDVAITSYQSFVNDAEKWHKQNVQWLILDEAQTIKNPKTQVRKVLAEASCSQRLCLSGTPVENHLGEMWSLLDFLMPGVLGGVNQFKQYYQTAIEKQNNEQRFKQFLKRISPFVLRRTKTEVAVDLPPKTEITQTIELPDAQYSFYEEVKNEYWQQLEKDLAGVDNAGEKHMLVLTALLKLRQICCDPALIDGEHSVPSGKTEYCVNMLQQLVDEGRSVLVFSQFTSMLDILAKALKQQGIPYFLLTGKTQNRGELVEAFQAGKAPVFLISLKAGGAGLNLTKADTVIHFDPWWNSAAQAQASDRAHRIGQDKPVFVYKLIAQNTIEEKIAVLQVTKAAYSDAVNQTAQASAQKFALGFNELLELWH